MTSWRQQQRDREFRARAIRRSHEVTNRGLTNTALAAKKMAAAKLHAIRLAPYFAHGLDKLRFAPKPGLGTLGVTKRGLCYYDPDFIIGEESWSTVELAAVIVHEMMHVLSNHAERALKCGVQMDEHYLFNIAADAEINYKLRRQFDLPDNPPYPESIWGEDESGHDGYSSYEGLEPKQLFAEVMFEHLRKRYEESAGSIPANQNNQLPPQDGEDDGEGEGEGGQNGEGDENGESQSGSAESDDGTGEDDADGDATSKGNADPTEAPSENGNGSGTNENPCQDWWENEHGSDGIWGECGSGGGNQPEGINEEELEKEHLGDDDDGWKPRDVEDINSKIATQIIEEGHCRGYGHGGMRRWAEEVIRGQRLPWYVLLNKRCRSLVQAFGGSTDFTYKRPSRRQMAVGTNPNDPRIPSMRGTVPNVGISIDLSGSVGTQQIIEMKAQVENIRRQLGCSLTVSTFDNNFLGAKKVRSIYSAEELFENGGGGTCIKPVFDYFNETKNKPDVLVIFTDGYIYDTPEKAPTYPVIWCLVGEYTRKPRTTDYEDVTYGDVINCDISND